MPSRDVARSSPNMAVDADNGFLQALAMVKPIATILAASLFASFPAQAEDAPVLLQKYKCNSCHAEDETRTGICRHRHQVPGRQQGNGDGRGRHKGWS